MWPLLFAAYSLHVSPVYGDQLGQQAMAILKNHCYGCHGVKHNGDPHFDVGDLTEMKADGYIVPGDPNKSKVYKRMAKGEMPPEDYQGSRPTKEQIQLIGDWIKSGSKGAVHRYVDREMVSERWARDIIRGDATNKRFRYFSLVNLYNQGLNEDQLAVARAALCKAINLVHLSQYVIVPKQVDKRGLIFRVDQDDLGWDNKNIQQLFDEYPYHEANYYLRADWFTAKALVPPLYHWLLLLPKTDTDLEQALGVNTNKNFLNGRQLRAGTTNSGVTFFNRVYSRDAMFNGSYWRSYDFNGQDGVKDVISSPLGPVFKDNDFVKVAFVHNGSEIIFTLPNGFPGFFVVDADGNRLNAAPTEVVIDPSKISGTGAVVPGLSCITCHTNVMQTKLVDEVRSGFPFGGLELQQVATLYRAQDEINKVLEADKEKYMRAVKKATDPFTSSNVEPIREVVERYNQPITLEQAATEVAVDPHILQRAILVTDELQRLGLRPLAEGRTISRQTWESDKFGQFTPAQAVVKVLSLYQE